MTSREGGACVPDACIPLSLPPSIRGSPLRLPPIRSSAFRLPPSAFSLRHERPGRRLQPSRHVDRHPRAAGVSAEQTGEALDHWRRVFRETRGGAAVDVQSRRGLCGRRGGRGAQRRAGGRLSGPLPQARSGRSGAALVSLRRRGGGAAPVHRGRQPRQHGGGRAADSRPGEGGLPGGGGARQRRSAVARGLSGGHPRRPPRGRRDGHPPAPGEHPQRGRGRLRPADLRAIRRQADAGDRRGRDGRGNAALPPRRGRAADHGRQPAFRAGRRSWPGSGAAWRGRGRNCPRPWPPPTW